MTARSPAWLSMAGWGSPLVAIARIAGTLQRLPSS